LIVRWTIASSSTIRIRARRAAAAVAGGAEPGQRDLDHLEVVLHAVVDLLEQDLALLEAARELGVAGAQQAGLGVLLRLAHALLAELGEHPEVLDPGPYPLGDELDHRDLAVLPDPRDRRGHDEAGDPFAVAEQRDRHQGADAERLVRRAMGRRRPRVPRGIGDHDGLAAPRLLQRGERHQQQHGSEPCAQRPSVEQQQHHGWWAFAQELRRRTWFWFGRFAPLCTGGRKRCAR
jgi:hypothetical protein